MPRFSASVCRRALDVQLPSVSAKRSSARHSARDLLWHEARAMAKCFPGGFHVFCHSSRRLGAAKKKKTKKKKFSRNAVSLRFERDCRCVRTASVFPQRASLSLAHHLRIATRLAFEERLRWSFAWAGNAGSGSTSSISTLRAAPRIATKIVNRVRDQGMSTFSIL